MIADNVQSVGRALQSRRCSVCLFSNEEVGKPRVGLLLKRSGKSGRLKGCVFSPLCQRCSDGTSWVDTELGKTCSAPHVHGMIETSSAKTSPNNDAPMPCAIGENSRPSGCAPQRSTPLDLFNLAAPTLARFFEPGNTCTDGLETTAAQRPQSILLLDLASLTFAPKGKREMECAGRPSVCGCQAHQPVRLRTLWLRI